MLIVFSNLILQATEKNGFLKSGDWLFLRGQPVYVTGRQLAVDKLLAFLRNVGGNPVLAAHNAGPFHAPILKRFLASLDYTRHFDSQVWGLADTLPLFRKALQGGSRGSPSHSKLSIP